MNRHSAVVEGRSAEDRCSYLAVNALDPVSPANGPPCAKYCVCVRCVCVCGGTCCIICCACCVSWLHVLVHGFRVVQVLYVFCVADQFVVLCYCNFSTTYAQHKLSNLEPIHISVVRSEDTTHNIF